MLRISDSMKRAGLITTLAIIVTCFFIFDLDEYLTLDFFNSQQTGIRNYYNFHPVYSACIYFIIYVLLTCLSLPAATVMTLMGGAIFGLFTGIILVSFASSIGATLAFLLSRYLFRNLVQERYSDKLHLLNTGIEEEGPFYLFTLRMIPIFPFFIINVVMGLTSIRTRIFYLVSQAGMLPATIVYVNAGNQITHITSPGDILTPEILISFVLLGIFPLIAKLFIGYMKSRKDRA